MNVNFNNGNVNNNNKTNIYYVRCVQAFPLSSGLQVAYHSFCYVIG
jgi:hypothetical protein